MTKTNPNPRIADAEAVHKAVLTHLDKILRSSLANAIERVANEADREALRWAFIEERDEFGKKILAAASSIIREASKEEA